MFNAELVLNSYAQVMTVPPNVKYADLFAELQREAREAGNGLWGAVAAAYNMWDLQSIKERHQQMLSKAKNCGYNY
ncbi:thermonuclease family protein [Desulfofundulus salinus]|uniref:TNase-like domain-containing protein n=1 Tax=Desulfofundulus salinus TaxID=2419843 RepID=A0A494WZW9_9FIRM|nr:thermonuclease family protein [Desulfofundulus salinum]RKO66497.1 hypothetical protein D7024_05735 [Desulfofundulus salinum]